jgi:hypothetical protein
MTGMTPGTPLTHARTHARTQMFDDIREHHGFMKLRDSSKSSYGTVAAANAAAKSQLDKFRCNKLFEAKKSAMGVDYTSYDHDHVEHDHVTESREVFTHSEDADTDADQEFTEFTESTARLPGAGSSPGSATQQTTETTRSSSTWSRTRATCAWCGRACSPRLRTMPENLLMTQAPSERRKTNHREAISVRHQCWPS